MISKINFTGREGMLTKGVKQSTGYRNEALNRYVNEATIFSDAEKAQVERRIKKAKIADDQVKRHEFLSQTEPVNRVKSSEEFRFVSETSPHGSIDIKA